MTTPVAAVDIDGIATHPRVERACEWVRDRDAETLDAMRALVAIAAPTLEEGARARWMRGAFAKAALDAVSADDAGNVLGRLTGCQTELPPVVIAAHLDTVFPATTDLTVREENGRIAAPGIADNARGLAALLTMARALIAAEVRPTHSIVFAATVGEEGIGDLRGVKHLFREESALRAAGAFIAMDGTGLSRIVHRAVGSRRLRVRITGPGGHSWADRGAPNPIHAAADAIGQLSRLAPARDELAALAVGRIAGGTSVNAIPEEAWFEVDLRAEDRTDLENLERRVRGALRDNIEKTITVRRGNHGGLGLDIEIIGDRPCGATPPTSSLVRHARAATRHFGGRAELVASSTDANVPIALGIPAIALGAGGESGRTHTTDEWFSNERGPEGIQRGLLTLMAAAGVEN